MSFGNRSGMSRHCGPPLILTWKIGQSWITEQLCIRGVLMDFPKVGIIDSVLKVLLDSILTVLWKSVSSPSYLFVSSCPLNLESICLCLKYFIEDDMVMVQWHKGRHGEIKCYCFSIISWKLRRVLRQLPSYHEPIQPFCLETSMNSVYWCQFAGLLRIIKEANLMSTLYLTSHSHSRG